MDWTICFPRQRIRSLRPSAKVFAGDCDIVHPIYLCFPEYQIFSSAIVGGILPIATGVAMSIKRNVGSNKVHCFLGDMTAETGIAHECIKYSQNHDLPIRFIVEDNGESVCTETCHVWGMESSSFSQMSNPKVEYYRYKNIYPHAGAGTRVQF